VLRRAPVAVALLATALLATALALGACGGRADPQRATAADWSGTAIPRPPKAAPLRLRDSTGRPFDLAAQRGHAVFVSFLYTHCPDVCPLIAARLHEALAQLGPRSKQVRLVAVSVDPRGDTPTTVKRFLARHELTGRMAYLVGSKAQLQRVWNAWHVAAGAARADGEVDHSAPIFGVTGSGRMATVYGSNPDVAALVHDAPLLARR